MRNQQVERASYNELINWNYFSFILYYCSVSSLLLVKIDKT